MTEQLTPHGSRRGSSVSGQVDFVTVCSNINIIPREITIGIVSTMTEQLTPHGSRRGSSVPGQVDFVTITLLYCL
ncbi:hypothetical protein J6590_006547 [Homalodisca vitripennis]|nr:hypothetical protein J6590_006547 [Homalodisca vitripennis]